MVWTTPPNEREAPVFRGENQHFRHERPGLRSGLNPRLQSFEPSSNTSHITNRFMRVCRDLTTGMAIAKADVESLVEELTLEEKIQLVQRCG